MATVKAVAPDCARKDCGHSRSVHRKKTLRKRVLLKCAEPGCTCRTYLEPLPDGKPRPTAPNADKKYPAEVLTPDEIQAMIRLCSPRAPTGIRNRALLMLLYRSGLRLSEAVGDRAEGVEGIRPVDVNFDDHSLRVLHGKGDKSTTRYFDVSAEGVLMRWMDKRKELGFRNGGPLFCTLDGTPLHGQYVRNLVHRLGAKAGIEKRVHPHGLRHTFAVELDQANTPLTVIAKLLGHDNVATTAEYLQHLTNADAGRALEAINLPDLDLGFGVRRRLKVEGHETADGLRYHGICSVCTTIFEPGIRLAKRDVRGFLLPAFMGHECRPAGQPELAAVPLEPRRPLAASAGPRMRREKTPEDAPVPRVKRAAGGNPQPGRRVMASGTCSGCGEERGVRSDGTIQQHRVGGAACDGAGLPPTEAVMPVVAELVGMLEDQQREEGL